MNRSTRARVIGSAVLCTLLIGLLSAGSAHAMVIASSDGLGNADDAGATVPGWDYVGKRGGGSAVYLGGGWVLTAAHVTAGDVTLGSVVYDRDTSAGSYQLHMPGDYSKASDLLLFKILNAPSLPDLQIATSGVTSGQALYGIGYGADREAQRFYWDESSVETSPGEYELVWTEVGGPNADYTGYKWHYSSRTKRWGQNRVSASTTEIVVKNTSGAVVTTTQGFQYRFDLSGQGSYGDDEMMGVAGDSGGAIFAQNAGGEWVLAGIQLVRYATEGQFENEPSRYTDGFAVDGNLGGVADLSAYWSQISAIIPEPATMTLLGLGLAGLVRRRRAA